MKAKLLVSLEGEAVSSADLVPPALEVGRDPANGLVLKDSRVSRRHLRFEFDGTKWTAKDLGSTHGTFFGGSRIEARVLEDGDRLRIGEHEIVFACEGALKDRGAEPSDPSEEWLRTVIKSTGSTSAGNKRLQALFEMSRILEGSEPFEEVLDRLIDRAISIMGAERGFLMLKDPKGEGFRVEAARGAGSEELADSEARRISATLVERVVESGEPILLENAMSDEEWGTESAVLHEIHSCLCAPLKTQDAVVGVLYVDHRRRPRMFTKSDLAFFTTVALQTKTAIDQSRAHWEIVEGLFNASEDFVVLVGLDGGLMRGNPKVERLLGGGVDKRAAVPFENLFPAAARPRAADSLKRVLSGETISGEEISLSGQEGTPIPVSLSGFALRNRKSEITGGCFVGRDLSEIRSLIEELKTANRKLAELNNMKSEYVGMVSHELKSPLSVMIGFTDLLLMEETGPLNPEQAEAITKIQDRSLRVVRMIQELLDLTRIETGKTPFHPEPVDLKKTIEEVVEDQSRLAAEKKVKVEVDFPDDFPKVRADPDMIARLITNFTTNGIKYNKEGGTLGISVRRGGVGYAIRFRDEGIGLSAEDQKKLFTRFFRSDQAHEIEGTGLGLSIVKAILEMHRGEVGVESEPGQGATFTVTLPLSP